MLNGNDQTNDQGSRMQFPPPNSMFHPLMLSTTVRAGTENPGNATNSANPTSNGLMANGGNSQQAFQNPLHFDVTSGARQYVNTDPNAWERLLNSQLSSVHQPATSGSPAAVPHTIGLSLPPMPPLLSPYSNNWPGLESINPYHLYFNQPPTSSNNPQDFSMNGAMAVQPPQAQYVRPSRETRSAVGLDDKMLMRGLLYDEPRTLVTATSAAGGGGLSQWGENTTVITAGTSDVGFTAEDMKLWNSAAAQGGHPYNAHLGVGTAGSGVPPMTDSKSGQLLTSNQNSSMSNKVLQPLHKHAMLRHRTALGGQGPGVGAPLGVFNCAQSTSRGLRVSLAVLCVLSPMLMLILPKVVTNQLVSSAGGEDCDVECQRELLSIALKVVLLTLAVWSLATRWSTDPQNMAANTPRPHWCRVHSLWPMLMSLILAAHWTYFSLYVTHTLSSPNSPSSSATFKGIVMLVSRGLLDSLLVTHCLALCWLHWPGGGSGGMGKRRRLIVKVVRSPDGAMQAYHVPCGVTVQAAACTVLQKYMKDFEFYNSFLENAVRRRSNQKAANAAGQGGNNNNGGNGTKSNAGRKAASVIGTTASAEQSATQYQQHQRHLASIAANNQTRVGLGPAKYTFYDVDSPTSQRMSTESAASPRRRALLGHRTALTAGMSSHNAAQLSQTNNPSTGPSGVGNGSAAGVMTQSHMSTSGATDRYYEECEFKKRVAKRRMRLVIAAEQAFQNVRKLEEMEYCPGKPLEAQEAAQIVFPTLLKPLQKFLRLTRQQSRYNMDAVLSHLALCLSFGISPKAFVQPFLSQGRVFEHIYAPVTPRTNGPSATSPSSNTANSTNEAVTGTNGAWPHSWTLFANCPVSDTIDDHVLFQLRQGDTSLMCTVVATPYVLLSDEFIDPMRCRFTLHGPIENMAV